MPEHHTISDSDKIADSNLMRSARGLLALRALPGVGAKTALRALFTQNFDAVIRPHQEKWSGALKSADEQLARCEDAGVVALSFFDDAYPERLRKIHEPPAVLFVRGSLSVLNERRSVAVVGTREPTSFGITATEALVKTLAVEHWAVVSGLARGIDTLAHGAALKDGTPTVAVMAGGLDSIYPKENRELAEAIVDQGGALVAEQPVGARPFASSFVDRNRIQTALSAAVMVMQTGIKGGTMHTARHAATQGRPIYCPVPHTHHERNEGLRKLLDTPGHELCGVLPAWKSATSLCRRLGDTPVAWPIQRADMDGEILERLAGVLDCFADEPQPRWWATLTPEETPTELPWDEDARRLSLFDTSEA
jgi:DNA processing protein